jgi:DMSO/TMAO reductase YedYZ molybdopterin-dependent catalytic subunit
MTEVDETTAAPPVTPLPPRQQLTKPGYWPVVGERAALASGDPWKVTIGGLVGQPRCWTLEQLHALPQTVQVIDIHCVTRWSMLGAHFTGIPLMYLLGLADPKPEARYISFVARSERNHSTSLPLDEALDLEAFIALAYEGDEIPVEHGGPIRVVVPGRYFYKSVKWLTHIELLAEDQLGYWEAEAGYHNVADPWLEQRYITEGVDPDLQHLALKRRDFSGLDLRSIQAGGRNLQGLEARRAQLRDGNFRSADLAGARFDYANLSNAHLHQANLQGASFVGADVEGADFTGATLRQANFTGASLFGATFYTGSEGAIIDRTTRFDADGLEKLAEEQLNYVMRRIA